MSKLYIANPKAQIESFTYVVPDDSQGIYRASAPRVQSIRAGGQVLITGDLNSKQIEAIVDQHRKYGLAGVDEIGGRNRPFISLVYSIDKPVSETVLQALMSNNTDVLVDKGRKMRELAGIAVHNGIENSMTDNQMPGDIRKLEMEVVEERTSRSDGPEMVAQRVRVTRDGESEQAPPKRTRRKA